MIAYFHPELNQWCELHSVTEARRVASQLADKLFQPIAIQIDGVRSAEYPTAESFNQWQRSRRKK